MGIYFHDNINMYSKKENYLQFVQIVYAESHIFVMSVEGKRCIFNEYLLANVKINLKDRLTKLNRQVSIDVLHF